MSEINPFNNLGPLTLLGAAVGSVGAEIVHTRLRSAPIPIYLHHSKKR